MTTPAVWQPISTAPKGGTEIVIITRRRRSVFKAMWLDGVVDVPGEPSSGAWVAVDEDLYPASWTDCVCWASNADGEASDPPEFWMSLS